MAEQINIDLLINTNIAEKNVGELKKLYKELGKGIETVGEGEQLDGLVQKMGEVKKVLKDVKDDIRTAAAGSGFEKLGTQLGEFKENLLNLNFKDAAGDISNFSSTLRGLSFKEAISGLKAVTMASWEFVASLMANPITWIVLGVAALVAGLAALLNSFGLMKPLLDSINAAMELMSSLFDQLTDAMGFTTNAIDEYAQTTVTELNKANTAWEEHTAKVQEDNDEYLQGLDDQIELLEARGAEEGVILAATKARYQEELRLLEISLENLKTQIGLQKIANNNLIVDLATTAKLRNAKLELSKLIPAMYKAQKEGLNDANKLQLENLGLTTEQVNALGAYSTTLKNLSLQEKETGDKISRIRQKVLVADAKGAKNAQDERDKALEKEADRFNTHVETMKGLNEELQNLILEGRGITASALSPSEQEYQDAVAIHEKFIQEYDNTAAKIGEIEAKYEKGGTLFGQAVSAEDFAELKRLAELEKKIADGDIFLKEEYSKRKAIIDQAEKNRELKSAKERSEAQKEYAREFENVTSNLYQKIALEYERDVERWRDAKQKQEISQFQFDAFVLAATKKLQEDLETQYKRDRIAFTENTRKKFDESRKIFLFGRLKEAAAASGKEVTEAFVKELDKIGKTPDFAQRLKVNELVNARYEASRMMEIIKEIQTALSKGRSIQGPLGAAQEYAATNEQFGKFIKNLEELSTKPNFLLEMAEDGTYMMSAADEMGKSLLIVQDTLGNLVKTGIPLDEFFKKLEKDPVLKGAAAEYKRYVELRTKFNKEGLAEDERTEFEFLTKRQNNLEQQTALYKNYQDIVVLLKEKANAEILLLDKNLSDTQRQAIQKQQEERKTQIESLKKTLTGGIQALSQVDPAGGAVLQTLFNNLTNLEIDYTKATEENTKARTRLRLEEALLSEKANERIGQSADALNTLNDSFANFAEARLNRELKQAQGNEVAQEAIRKKYFEKEKKFAIARTIISGAASTANALATPPFPLGVALAIANGLRIASEVALIKSTTYQGGGTTTTTPGPSLDTGTSSSTTTSSGSAPNFDFFGQPFNGNNLGATGGRQGAPGTPIVVDVKISESEITNTQKRVIKMANNAEL